MKDPASHPLYQEALNRLAQRRADISRTFMRPCTRQEIETHPGTKTRHRDAPFDIITSCFDIDVTSLSGDLQHILENLEDDGLFLGVMAGTKTLFELRNVLMQAELDLTGGASPRVELFTQGEEVCRHLSAAGFALPVVDIELVTLAYPDLHALLKELRDYGRTNSMPARSRHFTPRRLFEKASALYAERYPGPDGNGITASAELLFVHGWKSANKLVHSRETTT